MRKSRDGRDDRFIETYRMLLEAYGPQGWWPVTPAGETTPRYTGGPRSAAQRFEVAVGAILTQNTAWSNAERAIETLNRRGLMSPAALDSLSEKALARMIRSSGYYNQKAKRLKTLATFYRSRRKLTREALLALNGIGPETADSILLYACDVPSFVVDAYTRRVFGNLGLVRRNAAYEEIRLAVESAIPREIGVYKEYHALVVEHGKKTCKKRPICGKCLLKSLCRQYLFMRTGRVRQKRNQ
jgi:endonuclease-3 related protein